MTMAVFMDDLRVGLRERKRISVADGGGGSQEGWREDRSRFAIFPPSSILDPLSSIFLSR
jgi:hypothetical protein